MTMNLHSENIYILYLRYITYNANKSDIYILSFLCILQNIQIHDYHLWRKHV